MSDQQHTESGGDVNPPAFPGPIPWYCDEAKEWSSEPGMDLRDFFAGQALAGLCSSQQALVAAAREGGGQAEQPLAAAAYAAADAMIRERARRTEQEAPQ